jgi:hypothetical protein
MRASAALACLASCVLIAVSFSAPISALPPQDGSLAIGPTCGSASLPITLQADPVGRAPQDAAPAPVWHERGWPQPLREVVATPVFADLDNDGTHEIVVGDDWNAYVYGSDGTLWSGWPVMTGGSQQQAAVADIDGDQVDEIIFGCNYPAAMLRVFTPHGVSKPGWPVTITTPVFTNMTCPVVVDLDGDDDLEVGVAAENGVHFFHANGTPVAGWPYLWPVPINNPQWSAPAVGDLDGDGALEVVVGNACSPNWGVHVIRADGTAMPGWPKVIKPVYSSPALADLDGDGDLEIIVQEGDPGSQGYRLWVWHHTGAVLAGWPRNIAVEGHSSRCNPAVADVDGDGQLEIVTATSDGKLHVLRANNTYLPGFPLATGAPDYSIISSPSVIDMDEDGQQEIFLTYWLANHQYLSGWRVNATVLAGFPKEIHSSTDLNAHASQHLLDMEGDGDLDLVTAGSSMNGGLLWVFEVNSSSFDPATSAAGWPKPRRDIVNTGCYPPVDPAGVTAVEPRSAWSLRLSPSIVRPGDLLSLQLPAGGSGIVEVWDLMGRRIAARSIAAGEGVASVPTNGLLDRRAGSGAFLMSWTPERGGPARTARVIVLGD